MNDVLALRLMIEGKDYAQDPKTKTLLDVPPMVRDFFEKIKGFTSTLGGQSVLIHTNYPAFGEQFRMVLFIPKDRRRDWYVGAPVGTFRDLYREWRSLRTRLHKKGFILNAAFHVLNPTEHTKIPKGVSFATHNCWLFSIAFPKA